MQRKWRRRASFCMLSAVPVITERRPVKSALVKRSVDSDDDGHLPDAIIEKVARANTVHNEHSQILPEIRAAPCPIHTKKDHKDPLKTDGRSPRRLTTHEPHNQLNVHTSTNKGCRMDINIRIPEQFPATVRQPMLPKNMTSKEYVMTWLVHGSEPNGNNHFPEIIPRRKKSLKVKMPDVKNS
ncbi:hypothetical protein MAR_036917 [Mya arenaria]|uniref:Uncharacterized protein n=1 Tax=Mya arenaria TaxID=6604 RepID=A0ABY7FLZ8_MYAAR|nr:hypothetical protein MAR_036917 [Mya arenaria]